MTAATIDSALAAAGLRTARWSFEAKLTQTAYAAWLAIPAVSARMLPGLSPGERASRIEKALATVDCASWRWERWRGWTGFR